MPWLLDKAVPPGLVEGVGLFLFDFDGPMCSLFHEHDPAVVRAAVLAALDIDGSVPRRLRRRERNAHVLLRAMWQLGSDHVETANKDLTDHEFVAAGSALPTPQAKELIERLWNSGILMAITSNNSAAAIREYLDKNGLADFFGDRIYARGDDLGLMKPNAHTLTTAVAMRAPTGTTVLLGDSPSDAEAAWRAGVGFIGCVHPSNRGYWRSPWRWRDVYRLRSAGARVVIRDPSVVITAFPRRVGV
jgi:phosphoglycolate phosphatase-like HAD superfamily hydrolase